MKLNRVEDVIIKNDNKEWVIKAKIDTGADRTSIDISLVKELGLELLNEFKSVRNINGRCVRQLVKFDYLLKGQVINTIANTVDRSNLTYQMIIGCNDLKGCEVVI